MPWLEPVTLRGAHARLEPLSHDHRDGLIEAVKDGELSKLWYTSIPTVENMSKEIDRRLGLQKAGTMLPFTVLAIVLCMGRMMGTARVSTPQRTVGVIISGAFFLLVLVNFAWFWPIYTNGLLTHSQWLSRIWFQRWI